MQMFLRLQILKLNILYISTDLNLLKTKFRERIKNLPLTGIKEKDWNGSQKRENHAEWEYFTIYTPSNSLKLWEKCVLPSEGREETAKRKKVDGRKGGVAPI